jgi:hypothetical protein
MAEGAILESRSDANGIDGETSSIEAKRNKIRFNRSSAERARETFGDSGTTSSRQRSPRKPRDKTTLSIDDSRPEDSQKVKGRAPKEPDKDEEKEPTRRGRQPVKRKYPTIEDSSNTAKFLLSAVEIAAVTASGPNGEMTEWERGIIQAPLQRIIARTPIGIVEKGGLFIDIGFLTVGFGVYLSRVTRGISLPDRLKKKPKVETQEDTAAPISARAEAVVPTTKAGDRDGLAVPIPSAITANMNGAI